MNPKQLSLHLLGLAGIEVNGKNPWDIQVHDDRLWNRIISQRELGLAEAYMDGWWDVESIDQFLTKLLEINVLDKAPFSISLIGHAVKSTVLNRQTKAKAAANAKHHYNIGNDLYARMLDKEMAYSCGYWKSAKTLDQAQIAKFDLICRKLELKPGMKLLDIGCGWGGLLRYAAKNYGIIGTGISPADNQIELARAKNGKLKIEYLQMDYRDLSGNFDRIVSVGMMEHVGPKNLETFLNSPKIALWSGVTSYKPAHPLPIPRSISLGARVAAIAPNFSKNCGSRFKSKPDSVDLSEKPINKPFPSRCQ